MERNTKDPFGIDAYLSQVPRLNFVALENRGNVKLSPKAREKIQVVVDELYTDAVFSTKPTKPAREQLVKFEQAVERAANVAKEVLHSYRQLTPSMQLRMLQVLDNKRRFSRWAEALQKSGKVELHHPMRETKTPPRAGWPLPLSSLCRYDRASLLRFRRDTDQCSAFSSSFSKIISVTLTLSMLL